MSRPLRVTWFAALAILVLCAICAALGWQWLALEREVATRRSADTAEAAMASVRRALVETLQSAARVASRDSARARPGGLPPFARPSGVPPLVQTVVVIDAGGHAASEGEEAVARAAAGFAAASTEPAWRLAMSSIDSLEASRRTGDALAAARQLLHRTDDPALTADALVTITRLAAALGDRATAEEAARRVFSCCAAARDEYGMSFLLYAARQRLGLNLTARQADVLRETGAALRTAIAAGDLGSVTDEDALRQLAQRWPGHPEIGQAVSDLAVARRAAIARADFVRRVTAWLADETAPGIRLGSVEAAEAPELLAAAPIDGGERVVMTLDSAAVTAWIADWSAAHAAFDIALDLPGAPTTSALVRSPLTSELPSWQLAARVRASDPGAEDRRARLVVGAIGAAMLLAIMTGMLVVRDVSRELRVASLQSTFVAGVTHELKTPLTSIRLLAETLRHGRARPEQSSELLDTLTQEAERVSRLVDNVLSSSRIQSGTRIYARHPAVLQDVIEAGRRRFESVVARAGFRLTVAVESSPLRVSVDGDAFEQAILNLLINAAKYTDASAAPEIRLVVARHGQQAETRVEDHGRGVAPADRHRIFDRFYRAPNVRADTAGAGLGLTLVKHFAEAHGGRASVQSEVGQGSAFSIWLPLIED